MLNHREHFKFEEICAMCWSVRFFQLHLVWPWRLARRNWRQVRGRACQDVRIISWLQSVNAKMQRQTKGWKQWLYHQRTQGTEQALAWHNTRVFDVRHQFCNEKKSLEASTKTHNRWRCASEEHQKVRTWDAFVYSRHPVARHKKARSSLLGLCRVEARVSLTDISASLLERGRDESMCLRSGRLALCQDHHQRYRRKTHTRLDHGFICRSWPVCTFGKYKKNRVPRKRRVVDSICLAGKLCQIQKKTVDEQNQVTQFTEYLTRNEMMHMATLVFPLIDDREQEVGHNFYMNDFRPHAGTRSTHEWEQGVAWHSWARTSQYKRWFAHRVLFWKHGQVKTWITWNRHEIDSTLFTMDTQPFPDLHDRTHSLLRPTTKRLYGKRYRLCSSDTVQALTDVKYADRWVEYKFIQNHSHPKRVNFIQNHFHPNTTFIPKPLSSKTSFIQNQFHPKNDFYERTTANKSKNNIVSVCVRRRLHTNTAYARLLGFNRPSCGASPAEGRRCSTWRSVEGRKAGV